MHICRLEERHSGLNLLLSLTFLSLGDGANIIRFHEDDLATINRLREKVLIREGGNHR